MMKNSSSPGPSSPRDSSTGPATATPGGPDLRTRPLQEEISALARELWRKYGCPVGRDEAIWLEAERQVLGADPAVAQVNGQATAADALNQSAISGSTASPGGEGRDPRSGDDAERELVASTGPAPRSPRRRRDAR